VTGSITVFEPFPVNGTLPPADVISQGSRVTSITLSPDNGRATTVELGASVLYKAFYLVSDMIRNDATLETGKPFNTGKIEERQKEESRSNHSTSTSSSSGLGIYNGHGQWALLPSRYLPRRLQLALRYNWDLLRATKICQQFLTKFALLPALLKSQLPETFFDSPTDIWRALGLENAVYSSFDDLLDVIGVSKSKQNQTSLLSKVLPVGNLRDELLTAINLVNYNQDNAHVNGIVGMGSLAASMGGLFSIKGGNYQIIQSAFQQAVQNRKSNCHHREQSPNVTMQTGRVTTVVGGLDGLTLYADDRELGHYDIVILAVPLQQSNIQFLVKSHFDGAVLQPMPLAGLVNAHDESDNLDEHEGHIVLPESLPDSAVRPYTQVVTTVVSDAVLQTKYFNIAESNLPRSIAMTVAGKTATYNITSITQITSSSGIYKMFSNNELSKEALTTLFGPDVKTEYVKVWGGPHGGATPDYQGEGVSTNFLLYDGAVGFSGHTSSGALYYPPAMEQSTLSCMEIAAIGAKAVAKLVSERVGLLERREEPEIRDEL
jgi:hypothetical protein